MVTCFVVLSLLAPAAAAQIVGRIAEGVYRFDAGPDARIAAIPSMSFRAPQLREAVRQIEDEPPIRPAFATDDAGRQVVRIGITPGTSLYGTGECSGPLERTGRLTIAWNTDAYAYDDDTVSMYQSHPWVLAVRRDGSAFGALADTTHRVEMDLTDGVTFTAEGPPHPVIVIEGDSPQEVIVRLTDLIGRIKMPPKWAIGYQQCRYSYYPDTRVREVAREFRRRRIPCDVIWHDIHYMDAFKVFTFDPELFPDPRAHNAYLHDLGFHTAWMIDPGVAVEEGYRVYDELSAGVPVVRNAAGEPFIGKVWPGDCLFPDFTNQEARAWWAGLYEDFMAMGVDGVWNDMNEPAVFETEHHTMPESNLHDADLAFGGPATHARFHNVYGMLMSRATWEGVRRANPDKRPFVLTRASFIGGHRYAAMWTGDNVADWYHVDISIPMVLNMGLSGQPFAGPDIGGFKGPSDAEQFARWMGIGALLPFARAHTEVGQRDKEPWSFGPETEAACRLAIERRYQLFPLLYTLFREASLTGLPVARPLFFADADDPRLREVDDGFLLGDSLLAWCQVDERQRTAPVLPEGIWRPVALVGAGHPDLPEMFIRGGGIIPTGPIIQFAGEKPLDPLTLLVCLDEDGRARGTLYEDAGDGWDHLRGDHLTSTYAAVRDGDLVTVRLAGAEGDRVRPDRTLVVRLITEGGERVASGRDGEPITIDLARP